jgi:hypothetical protein
MPADTGRLDSRPLACTSGNADRQERYVVVAIGVREHVGERRVAHGGRPVRDGTRGRFKQSAQAAFQRAATVLDQSVAAISPTTIAARPSRTVRTRAPG